MSNLTELLPAGGSGKTVDFVASGTLPNGKPVILKADGTVEVVGESSSNYTLTENIPSGSETVAPSGDNPNVEFLNSTQFLYVYVDTSNSYYTKGVVGTISGTTLTFGTPVTIYSSRQYVLSMSLDPNTPGSFVIVSKDSGNLSYGTVSAGTVVGTTITMGTPLVYSSYTSDNMDVTFDPNNPGKFLIISREQSNVENGIVIVGTASGTTLTLGSKYSFRNSYSNYCSISMHPLSPGKFLVNSAEGKVIAGSYSGTTVTYGTEASLPSGWATYNSITFVSGTSDAYLWAYRSSTGTYATAVIVTVNPSTLSSTISSAYVLVSTATSQLYAFSDAAIYNKALIATKESGLTGCDDTERMITATISGTALSFGTPTTMLNTGNYYRGTWADISFDPNNPGKFIYAASTYGSGCSDGGVLSVGQLGGVSTVTTTNLTTDNFLGTSTEAYADTDTATILLQGGISTNQSGLTIGSDYYVQEDGTLATTADTISVKLGKALSATSILLSGE